MRRPHVAPLSSCPLPIDSFLFLFPSPAWSQQKMARRRALGAIAEGCGPQLEFDRVQPLRRAERVIFNTLFTIFTPGLRGSASQKITYSRIVRVCKKLFGMTNGTDGTSFSIQKYAIVANRENAG
jgi:hypothetical protein